jgi:cytochrome c-type biogenesis protein CcmH/NrfG
MNKLFYFWFALGFICFLATLIVVFPITGLVRENEQGIFRKPNYLFILFNKKLILLSGIVTLTALVGYYYLGSSQALFTYYARLQQKPNEMSSEVIKSYGTPADITKKMRQMLQKNPNSSEGWYLLGRLYFSQSQYSDASHAFAFAYKLAPNNLNISFQYAQSLYYANHQKLTRRVNNLLNEILEADPQNYAAHHLLALAAYHQHHYNQAIEQWTIALATMPAESDETNMIRKAIAQAKLEAGQQ